LEIRIKMHTYYRLMELTPIRNKSYTSAISLSKCLCLLTS